METEQLYKLFDENCKFKIGDVVYRKAITDERIAIPLIIVERSIGQIDNGFEIYYWLDGPIGPIHECTLTKEKPPLVQIKKEY